MHEGAVAQAILEKAVAWIKKHKEKSLSKIIICCGEFRNIDKESLSFAFDSLKNDFIGLEACNFEIEQCEAIAICSGDKKHQYKPLVEGLYRCPHCLSGMEHLLQGEEMEIRKFIIQTTEEAIHA